MSSPRLPFLLIPSVARDGGSPAAATYTQTLSLALAVLLIVAYGLGMVFSLGTHRELFASEEHTAGEAPWPMRLALATLVGVTVLVALVAEILSSRYKSAAEAFGMTPGFVGFVIVALVGGAAEMASAFSGARQNRLDLRALITWVRWRTCKSRAQCMISTACCSSLLIGTKRMEGRVAASQIAAASAASFFPRLR
jgi:calcium/proton exchanger cax